MFSRGKRLVELALRKGVNECTDVSDNTDSNNNELSDCGLSDYDDDLRDPDFVPPKRKKQKHKVSNNAECRPQKIVKTKCAIQTVSVENVLACNETLSSTNSSDNESDERLSDDYTLPNRVMDPNELFINPTQAYKDNVLSNATNEFETLTAIKSIANNPVQLPDSAVLDQTNTQDTEEVEQTLIEHQEVEQAVIHLEEVEQEVVDHEEFDQVVIDHEEVVVELEDDSDKLRQSIEQSTNITKLKNKRLRMTGLQYKGVKKDVNGQKRYCENRTERTLSQSYCSSKCEKRIGGRRCNDIDQTTRESIFKLFWRKMDWKQKKVYVLNMVDKATPKRREVEQSRKKLSYKYFLKINEDRVLVCKNMFLSTLGLNEKMMYQWVGAGESGVPINESIEGLPNNSGHEAKTTEGMEHAIQYLNSLPKLPSHYCRASTSKQYLEPLFVTLTQVHNEYINKMTEESKPTIQISQFRKQFSRMNLSLYRPKKDLCDICCGYEAHTVSESDYTAHIARKDEARISKEQDKERSKTEDNVKVVTVDLQSLLLCPKLNASSLYYKTKLSCHNYTIFDLATRKVMCYFWHECDGELTANIFTTCLIDYLSTIDFQVVNHVIIYSDGCGYQNRNVTLSNALLQFACDHKITIEQKILERGHTQMECDSVHSVIERSIRKTPIYVPQQYVDKIQSARKVVPYDLKYLDYTFFKNFSNIGKYSSIRPGTGVGSETVNDIRALQYTDDNIIRFKTSLSSEYKDLPEPRKPNSNNLEPEALYSRQLPLKKTKFQHLQQLKSVIPKDYHAWYDNLPHY